MRVKPPPHIRRSQSVNQPDEVCRVLSTIGECLPVAFVAPPYCLSIVNRLFVQAACSWIVAFVVHISRQESATQCPANRPHRHWQCGGCVAPVGIIGPQRSILGLSRVRSRTYTVEWPIFVRMFISLEPTKGLSYPKLSVSYFQQRHLHHPVTSRGVPCW